MIEVIKALKDAAREEEWAKFPEGSKQKIAYGMACRALEPAPKVAKVKPKTKTKGKK